MNAHEGVFLAPEVWRTALGLASGERLPAQWPEQLHGVTPDSRQVRPGVIFHAVQGTHMDGHAYLDEAVRRGATGLVVEKAPGHPMKAPHVVVPDSRAALARLACAFHGNPAAELNLVGVTGTNGKTTVAAFVRQLLEGLGLRCGMLGTVSYAFGSREIPARRTTPGAPELHGLLRAMRDADCTECVMEISSHALDQRRVEGLEVDTAVFTNLSQDHLDYHLDMESYFRAKARLFAFPSVKTRIVGEDLWSRRLSKTYGESVWACGLNADCAIRAEALHCNRDGTRAQLITPWGAGELILNIPGHHNVRNALQAIAVVAARGIPLSSILPLVPGLKAAPGRLESIPSTLGRVVVDYAHTPDALGNILTTLRPLTKGRLIVVFGCGGDRDRGKRAPMAAHAAAHGDFLILTQDNPRTEDSHRIFTDMLAGIPSKTMLEVIPDRAAAIRRGVDMLGPDDLLLIAGKGHEATQEFANSKVPFDDREVARKCLRRRDLCPAGGPT
ncbi:MAG: UDP-N-acetylmuramoyl-L-alanyl-D-glutamate--2,6-diaminopimelate ligase [Verrucomicrobia bacterium]|nr:UDP-N-acetylmuramoyl-L-alanyl-D-glutamate--2,6-diaminopimelate ligase [Verrucomicrobiota bacterium]MCH8510876.1 UDP-N-acetylmuramoyl-L-alanyl-D-glutamate--2,6-diaminopimelate ligase [Kiritimatiellia bacterium]